MTDFATNFNVQSINIEPYILVDEASGGTFYIGTSKSFSAQGAPNWRIKKIYQDGTVWITAYPNGDQSFIFIWSNRSSYTYQ